MRWRAADGPVWRARGKAFAGESSARPSLAARLLALVGSRGAAAMAPRALDRILIVQLQNVGDTVIFAPALHAIRARYPKARIDVLVHRVGAQLYRSSPLVNDIIVEPTWGRRRLPLPSIATLRRLRAARYDAVVTDATETAFAYALLARLVGAPVRVGFNVHSRGHLHTVRVPYDDSRGLLAANLAIARAIGADAAGAREHVFIGDADRAHALRLLERLGLASARPLVVMHPATNWQSKTWFEDRWAAVADALVEHDGASVLFVGTAAEREYIERVRSGMRTTAAVAAGDTDLPQLAALIEHADLFVGTDSGPRHLAGALGRPQVTLFSSQDYAHRWSLERPNETRLRTDPACSPCLSSVCGHRLCMDLITTVQVIDACRHHLAGEGGERSEPRASMAAPASSL